MFFDIIYNFESSKIKFFKLALLNNKFLLITGDASYSLYLWHLPVIFFSNIFFVGLDYYFFSTFITFSADYGVLFIVSIHRKTIQKIFKNKKFYFNKTYLQLKKLVFCF